MEQIATFLFVVIGLTLHLGSSQLYYPSRHYIPSNTYLNSYQSVINPTGSFATSQRNAYSVQTDSSASDVVKSVYFFESRPEEEETRIRIRLGPSQKKTRVIFIKAPETKVVPEVIAPRPAEERTVVYVLSKKLEPLGSITIPSKLVTPVKRKPEVYYIKYRDLKHAQHLLEETLRGRENGATIPTHASASSFLKALEEKRDNHLDDGKIGSVSRNLNGQVGYGKPGISGPY